MVTGGKVGADVLRYSRWLRTCQEKNGNVYLPDEGCGAWIFMDIF